MSTSIGQPASASPFGINELSPGDALVCKKEIDESPYYDAVRLSDKYSIQSNPQQLPEKLGYI